MSDYTEELLNELKAPKKRSGLAAILVLLSITLVTLGLIFIERQLEISDVELGVLSKTAAEVMTKNGEHRVSTLDIWNRMVSYTGKNSTKEFTIFNRIEGAKYLIKLIETNSIDSIEYPYDPDSTSGGPSTR